MMSTARWRERLWSSAWAPYAAGLWALIFAVFHVAWALGWYVGLDHERARIAFAKPLFLAYDLVVAATCAFAVLVALSLVQPWGRRLPRGAVGLSVSVGTALLVLRAGGSVLQAVYLLARGRFDIEAMGMWEPWFVLGAILFAVSTWRYWRQRPAAGAL
jgi:uncharacterized protein DUF3995